VHSPKILGLITVTTLFWKYHIEELKFKLNKVCYANKSIKQFMPLEVLRITYFSYVHSILSYGIILGENSSH
jgi:hypothetical protein